MPRHPYDQLYTPARALTNIEIVAVGLSGLTQSIQVEMLLDTGADLSCIPRTILSQLLSTVGPVTNSFIDLVDPLTNQPNRRKVFELSTGRLDMGNGGRFLFVPISGTTGIIGRNILNLHSVTFNGPSGWWNY